MSTEVAVRIVDASDRWIDSGRQMNRRALDFEIDWERIR